MGVRDTVLLCPLFVSLDYKVLLLTFLAVAMSGTFFCKGSDRNGRDWSVVQGTLNPSGTDEGEDTTESGPAFLFV